MKGLLKIHRWWDYQLAVMLGMVYQVMGMTSSAPPLLSWLLTFALFVVASIGIAGFGHLVNDYFDQEQDRRSGASSLVVGKSRPRVAATFVVVLVLAVVPWIWIATNPAIIALLVLEFVLFIGYSMPPVRLKERGLLGPITDAMYSYTVSTTVAILVFGKLAGVQIPVWLCLLVATWSFLVGLRQILRHQIEDATRDQLAGLKTFVTSHGWPRTLFLLEWVVQPSETVLFLVILLVFSTYSVITPFGFVLFAAWILWRRWRDGIWHVANPWKLPRIDRLFFINTFLLYRFYTHWFPLFGLISLAGRNPSYLLVAVLHVYLFNNGLKDFVRPVFDELRSRWLAHRVLGSN